MVMESLLFGHTISRVYDLKSIVFFHSASLTQNDHDTVYLDQNYVKYMGSPIYIGGRTRHLLQHAIWNDTSPHCKYKAHLCRNY